VGLGAYAMVLFVLGLDDPFEKIADPRNDEQGPFLDEERLPKRVRTRKIQTP